MGFWSSIWGSNAGAIAEARAEGAVRDARAAVEAGRFTPAQLDNAHRVLEAADRYVVVHGVEVDLESAEYAAWYAQQYADVWVWNE